MKALSLPLTLGKVSTYAGLVAHLNLLGTESLMNIFFFHSACMFFAKDCIKAWLSLVGGLDKVLSICGEVKDGVKQTQIEEP